MVYRYINSSVVVYDVFDKFNIKSEEFIDRTPNWIINCLEDIHSYYIYIDKFYKDTTYQCRLYLPDDFKKIRNIWINGEEAQHYNGYSKDNNFSCNTDTVYRFNDKRPLIGITQKSPSGRDETAVLNTIQVPSNIGVSDPDAYIYAGYNPFGATDLQNWINRFRYDEYENKEDNDETKEDIKPSYYIENNWIKTNVDGEVVIKYAALPIDYDDASRMWFPLMPDNVDVRECLSWYIMSRILYRGYIHPLLNLTDNNPFTNPALAYKQTALKARMSCASMNLPMRREIANSMKIKFGAHNGYKTKP